jgi:hypothetical protein
MTIDWWIQFWIGFEARGSDSHLSLFPDKVLHWTAAKAEGAEFEDLFLASPWRNCQQKTLTPLVDASNVNESLRH